MTLMITRRRFSIGLVGTAAFGPSSFAFADEWPSRAIRVLSAGAPGSSSDIYVRLIEPFIRERLGQPLILENRPGAGGMVAAGLVSKAPPDGYTLFISNSATNAIGVTLYQKPTFNPNTDLPAIARMASMSNVFAVRTDRNISTVAELRDYIKANPSKATYGSAGAGTSSHLLGVLFGQKIGAELVHVPYRGTAANLQGVLGGEVLFAIDNLPLYLPHAKSGAIRLLAVTQSSRSAQAPDVPTVVEIGLPELEGYSWYGLSASTGTPPAIINRLSDLVVSAINSPDISARIRDIGAEPAPLAAADYAAFIQSEIRKWAPVVKSSGATVE